MKKRDVLTFDDRLRDVFPKIAICSCVMAAVLSMLGYVLQPYFQENLLIKILALVALLGGGAITYALAVHVSGVLKISDIKKYLSRKKGVDAVMSE